MLNPDHDQLLALLRKSATNEERRSTLETLVEYEEQQAIESDRLMELVKDDNVLIQSYAVGALGRRRDEKAIPRLIELYGECRNPVILTLLLDTFSEYGSSTFVDAVLRRLGAPSWKERVKRKLKRSEEEAFDYLFLQDQILIPSLKYLHRCDSLSPMAEKSLRNFLNHKDSNIRWHTLLIFDKFAFHLDEKELIEIQKNDTSRLNREQASIMLEKRK